MPIYSFGVDSALKIEITEDQAAAYNRFTEAFFDAQIKLREAGTPWEPATQPLPIDDTEDDYETYNYVGSLINAAIATIDQTTTPIEIEEDYLIKN